MSYCGDFSLPGDFQQRINTIFSQTLGLAKEGKKEEALLGCDFILRLDSLFEPARRLQQQAQCDELIHAADLRALAGLDAKLEAATDPPPPANPALAASVALAKTSEDACKPENQKWIELRGSVRVPLSRPYRVDVGAGWEYHLRSGLFEAVAADLGEGGMFVNVASPHLEGSVVDFEVQFAGMGLIVGRGEVAWVCNCGSQPEHPHGLGIRFLELHGDSQKVVRLTMESASRLT